MLLDCLIWYLDYLIKQGYTKLNDIQIEDIDGNQDLKKQLELWKLVSGFEQLQTIGIIRDAETDAEAAIHSINQCFSDNDLTVPDAPFTLGIEALVYWHRNKKIDFSLTFL